MEKPATLIIILTLCSISLFGQNDYVCSTQYHHQFDFWVGDWIVYDTAGNVVGENTIEKLEKDCILSEHWRGGLGTTGRSYNYYNQADSTWNQVWIDSNGSSLVLKGKAEPGKMVMKSELLKGQKVDWYYNRITWTENPDHSVTQLWEILSKENTVLTTAFKGIYKRKE